MKRHTVIQGEFAISSDPNTVLTTVLGSCVAACVFDPHAGVGGMNHFLLSEQEGERTNGRDRLYGSYLMEVLLNGLYKKHARKENIKVKLFGGAKLFRSSFDPGRKNAEFITRFMRDEGFNVIATSLGGNQARRIEFCPVDGRTRQKLMTETVEEKPFEQEIEKKSHGELELF